MNRINSTLATLVVAIFALIGAISAFVDAVNGDGASSHQVTQAVQNGVNDSLTPNRTPVATVTLDGPGDSTIPQAPAGVTAQTVAGLALEADSRDEIPDYFNSKQSNAFRDKIEALAHRDQFPTVAPDAAPSWPGCTSRFVGNYSSRGGVAPSKLVAHITVSHNVPGWNDVWAIVNFFNSTASQASSNFVIDGEGHCAYIVRTGDKAWTQAAGNPISISIEFIAYGTEGTLTAAQYARGGQVFARAGKLYGIPMRRGSVVGCLGGLSGIVEHADGGACWGGHTDIHSTSGIPLQPLITDAQNAANPAPTITKKDNARCAKIRDFRARPAKARAKGADKRQKARLTTNKNRRLKCVHGKAHTT